MLCARVYIAYKPACYCVLMILLMLMLMVRAHMYTLRAYDYVYLDVYAYGLVCTGSTNAISDLVNNT